MNFESVLLLVAFKTNGYSSHVTTLSYFGIMQCAKKCPSQQYSTPSSEYSWKIIFLKIILLWPHYFFYELKQLLLFFLLNFNAFSTHYEIKSLTFFQNLE